MGSGRRVAGLVRNISTRLIVVILFQIRQLGIIGPGGRFTCKRRLD